MPHSKSVNDKEDGVLSDAPLENPIEDGETMVQSDASSDIAASSNESAKAAIKIELEKLFDDDDNEDDEFSPHNESANGRVESSPPAAPM